MAWWIYGGPEHVHKRFSLSHNNLLTIIGLMSLARFSPASINALKQRDAVDFTAKRLIVQ